VREWGWLIAGKKEVDLMKSKIVAMLLPLLLVSLSLLGACQAAEEVEVVELTYSNFFPPTHLHSILAEEWIKEVESRTKGAVKITYYPGGSLVKAAQTYDGIVQGITDIGMCVFAYTPGRFPACELVDLPHAYPNGWVATKVANDFYNKYKPIELSDVHPLYFHAHGPGVVFTTKTQVRQMEDLRGLVIRSTGIGASIMKALGAEGYGASQGEAYELLSKNVVDGSYTPLEVLKGWNQAEVVKYVTGSYDVGNTSMMFVVMNLDKWNALPASVQKVFTQVSEEWIEKHGKVWDYYDKVGLDYFLSLGAGRELIELPEEEMSRWVETAVDPLIEQYIEEKTAKGLPAAEYQEYLLQRVEYWSDRAPTAQQCLDYVESELKPLMPQE
jgi:TRAP-type C4-dicarboxylate transport system substrate-binding protein